MAFRPINFQCPHFLAANFCAPLGAPLCSRSVPLERAVWAAKIASPLRAAPPLFTALPFVQAGNASGLNLERKTIAWQTNATQGDFRVEFGPTAKYGRTASIERRIFAGADTDEVDERLLYSADLGELPLASKQFYRVSCNGQPIQEGFFTARQPRGRNIRFVAFGDNSYGEASDRAIAFQAWKANPDFVMNTGDNVYEGGLLNEYERHFFPVYNSPIANSRVGAPLLGSVPFYTVMANHDVHDKDADKNPVADFDKNRDSLAYYQSMYLPLNGPMPTFPTPMAGTTEAIAAFRQRAGARFPRMANYSFDYGDAHFLCLDANVYVDPTDAVLQSWIENDLKNTDAIWKFVTYHHPAFNVGDDHFSEQQMRVLMPLWEKYGVDFVLNGHEHTYQRTRPLKFAPTDISNAKKVNSKNRLVPGNWEVDRQFDGVTNTRANGVIHIVTGAGGKHLYNPGFTNAPERWRHPEDNNIEYVAQFVSDRHSLTLFEIDGKTLSLRQIDEFGQEIDAIRVTKA